MARRFSLLVGHLCSVAFIVSLLAAAYFFVDIESFAEIARRNLALSVQWMTVDFWQWYGLWVLTLLHIGLGLAGLFYLRRAFLQFAQGEFFTRRNSQDLRMFAVLLFLQALAKPLHHAFASVLLSWNHPPGQRMLAISLGSFELKVLVLAMILWVISDMLVRGRELEQENRQFV